MFKKPIELQMEKILINLLLVRAKGYSATKGITIGFTWYERLFTTPPQYIVVDPFDPDYTLTFIDESVFKVDVKGLEVVKRDWCVFMSRAYKRLLDMAIKETRPLW
jgi:DNA polymerase elongation subunit (family B)